MKNLTATICLTIIVLLGSMGVSASDDFQKGVDAKKSGDNAAALSEWTPLAEQGDDRAQFELGVMYRKGQGVTQDFETAVKWYRLAAEQGNSRAQNNLGHMYRRGLGVSKNYKTAAKWYRLAAEQGNSRAQSNLGHMYRRGLGVSKNYKTAAKWYRLAAEQGNSRAQNSLGAMHAEGKGVLQDYVRAHMWFSIAASSSKNLSNKNASTNMGGGVRIYLGKGASKKASKNIDLVEGKMTPTQIAEAQELARDCIRLFFRHKNYKGC